MGKKSGRGLLIHNNNVLLIKRFYKNKHYYTLPGGKKEDNENLENTTVREVFEETGIESKIVELIGKGKGEGRTHYLYLCEYLGGELNPEDNWKATEINIYDPQWVSLKKAIDVKLQPKSLRKIYINYLRDSINTLNLPITRAAKNIK